jgi:hypothetical protein
MSNGEHLSSKSMTGGSGNEFQALQAVISALQPLDQEARNRILDSAATFLGISQQSPRPVQGLSHSPTSGPGSVSSSFDSRPRFSDDTTMSPKDFMMEKAPKTDVERIACLAYYLTNYRGTQHFKTLDISTLNTEAAQPKFSNTTYSTNNAVKLGYIVSSTKGHRQLSALGERFVQALPDRNLAKEVLLSLRRKNRGKRKRTPAAAETSEEE